MFASCTTCLSASSCPTSVSAGSASVCRYYLSPGAGGRGIPLQPNAALSVEKSSRSAATGNEPNDDPDTAVSGSSSEEGDGGTCSTGADGGAKARAAAAAASTTAVDGDDAGYASSGHSESDADSDDDIASDSDTAASDTASQASDDPCSTRSPSTTQGERSRVSAPQRHETSAVRRTKHDKEKGKPPGVEAFFNPAAAPAPQLSRFGAAWRLLTEWISPSTILCVHGRAAESAETGESEQLGQVHL